MDQQSNPEAPRAAIKPMIIMPMAVALIAVGSLSLNILVPALPAMAKSLGVTPSMAQLTTSLYLVSFAVAQLFVGSLADRYGRRNVILVGIPLALVPTIACILLPTIELIILSRIIEAIGAAIGMVASRAIVRDIFDRERAAAAFGWVTTAMVIAPMIAPLIGGMLVVSFGWRSIFMFIAATYLLMAIPIWLSLPETGRHAQGASSIAQILKGAAQLLGNRAFLGYALVAAISSSTFFMLVGGAPFIVVETMHRSPMEYGLWFTLPSIGFMAGNITAARISARIGIHAMITTGVLLMLAGTIVGVLCVLWMPQAGPILLFAPAILISIGNGLMIPNALAGAVSVRPELAGTAAGFAGFMHYGSAAIAVQMMSVIATGAHGLLMLSAFMVAAMVISSSCYFLLISSHHEDA